MLRVYRVDAQETKHFSVYAWRGFVSFDYISSTSPHALPLTLYGLVVLGVLWVQIFSSHTLINYLLLV